MMLDSYTTPVTCLLRRFPTRLSQYQCDLPASGALQKRFTSEWHGTLSFASKRTRCDRLSRKEQEHLLNSSAPSLAPSSMYMALPARQLSKLCQENNPTCMSHSTTVATMTYLILAVSGKPGYNPHYDTRPISASWFSSHLAGQARLARPGRYQVDSS